MWDNIRVALTLMFQWQSVLAMTIGVAVGICIGALPGLSATMGVALVIPLTFAMPPEVGLLLIAGIYNGAIYGGSITALLIRVPGTPASCATIFDGYPMTQKGQANAALEVAISSSVFGGVISALALLFIAPPLAEFSLAFGPPEYFWLAVFGLTIIVSLASESMVKGLLSGCLGLFVGMIGQDPVTARVRFTFGIPDLLGGVELVTMLIGLFSIPQALAMLENKLQSLTLDMANDVEQEKSPPMFHLFGELWRTYVRSSIIGTVIGVIPGAGANIASYIGYSEARRNSKNPELFGTGIPEGVAASEAANNAVTGGSLIPLLTLGIPGNAVSAIVLGGLMIHGLTVGPQLFTDNADIVYTFMLGMLFTNLIMLFFGYYGARVFVNVIRIPNNVLAPLVIVLSVIGAFAIRNSMFDVGIMLFFGLVGYLMEKFAYPLAPAVLAVILGPMAESNLRRTMLMGRGSIRPLFTRPICWVLIVLTVVSLAIPFMRRFKKGKGREGSLAN